MLEHLPPSVALAVIEVLGYVTAIEQPLVPSVLLIIFAFFVWTWPNRLPGLPGPGRAVPYLGALPEILQNYSRLPDYSVDALTKYGGKTWGCPMPRVGLLQGAAIFVTTPETVKHVLKDNFANYEKGCSFRAGLADFLGDGIFNADGPLWKLHRKVASHMFSNRLLKESTFVTARHGAALVAQLKTLSAPGERGAPGGAGLDMQDMYFRLTMDIFTYIAFGEELHSVTRDEQHPFAHAFDEVQKHSQKRFFNPLWSGCRLLQLTEGERKIASGVRVMDAFASTVIASRRREIISEGGEGGGLGPDLLSRKSIVFCFTCRVGSVVL